MNIFDDINRWKQNNKTETDNNTNTDSKQQKQNSNYIPMLFYTEYTCPFFTFYYLNNKPYHFPPVLTRIFYYSTIIESYLSNFNILLNPAPDFFNTETLLKYITLIRNGNTNQSLIIAEKTNSINIRYKIKKFASVDNKIKDPIVTTIYTFQTNLIQNYNNYDENKILNKLDSNNNIIARYYYFCELNKCPYFHICKMKDKL